MLRINLFQAFYGSEILKDNSCHAVRDIIFLNFVSLSNFLALTPNSGGSEKKFKNYLYSYTVVGNQISKRELFQESSVRCD